MGRRTPSGRLIRSPAMAVKSKSADLFDRANPSVGPTPIAQELQAYFEHGGSIDGAVPFVAPSLRWSRPASVAFWATVRRSGKPFTAWPDKPIGSFGARPQPSYQSKPCAARTLWWTCALLVV